MKKLIFERGALKILKNGVRKRVQREKTVQHANFQRCIRIFARHFLKVPDYSDDDNDDDRWWNDG